MNSRSSRVLVAEAPSIATRLRDILSAYHCTSVRTVEEAKHLLSAEDFSLIVVCMQFDESRMYELLDHILNDERIADTPVICIRDVEGPAGNSTKKKRNAIELSVTALGAKCFLDLRKIANTPQGNARVSQLIEHMLLLEDDMKAYRSSGGSED